MLGYEYSPCHSPLCPWLKITLALHVTSAQAVFCHFRRITTAELCVCTGRNISPHRVNLRYRDASYTFTVGTIFFSFLLHGLSYFVGILYHRGRECICKVCQTVCYSHGNIAVPHLGWLIPLHQVWGLEYMFMERPAEYMGCFIPHAWEGGVSFSISFLPQFTSLCLYLPQFAFTENLTKNTTFPWILFLETCHKKKKRLRILLKRFHAINALQTLFKCSLTPRLSFVKFLIATILCSQLFY